jgi:hypothetical protein
MTQKESEIAFWAKVKINKPDECWPWTGKKHPYGYGVCKRKRKGYLTHRMAYEFAKGKIPNNHLICHHCDNPPCCNPRHLFVGTHSDNRLDAASKHRLSHGTHRHNAVLDDNKVRYILSMYCPRVYTQQKLADELGVSRELIRYVVSKGGWKHVERAKAK